MPEVYQELRALLFSIAYRMIGSVGDAEDIVQETFLRAWRQLPGLLEDDRPVRAWLLRVTRRLLIDATRAAQARPMLSDAEPTVEAFVDGGLDQLVDRTILLDAMRQLSPPHQQILVETFFLGTPMHVTAARLGVPAGTARSRLHYALGQLRRQLDSRRLT
ncbi:MAG: polymerase sigma-70 factor, subfamily [Pseudonocardiales bacterium]|nr:polymerase sigma-70 factor, subfamily [Pseudonocardiales bacterium]